MSRIRMLVMLVACCAVVAPAQNKPATSSEAPARQSQAASQPVHVSTEVMLGLVERKTMPVYPEEAMKKGIQGNVVFKIDVDETGKITSTDVLGGDPLLVAASKDALRTFRFHPYLLNETPVKVQSQMGFH